MDEETTTRRRVLWGIGVIVVLFYALIPVIWIISLSLKTPETIGDGRFLRANGRSTTTTPSSTPGSSPPPCATRSASR